MKKSCFALCVLVLFLAVSGLCLAEDPPTAPTEVKGTTGSIATWDHGTDLIGGFSGATSTVTLDAKGDCFSMGDIFSKSKASGGSITGSNSATSFSLGSTFSKGEAEGNLGAEIGLKGTSEQGNWATFGTDDNSGAAWNDTTSSFDGLKSKTPEVEGFGASESVGKSTVSTDQTANSLSAHSLTEGNSLSFMNAPGTTSASGKGGIDTFSSMTGTNFFGGAVNDGSMLANATGMKFTGVSIEGFGNTLVKTLSDCGIEASSSLSLTAKAKNGDCPGCLEKINIPPCPGGSQCGH